MSKTVIALAFALVLGSSVAQAALPCSADPACSGVTDQGAINSGVVDQGKTDQGIANQGQVGQGAVDQGTWNQGVIGQGTIDQGHFDQGKRQYMIDTGRDTEH